jgi:alkanesulfonate monooxygenase SsuD/methylene tetrahydromethanopterin reductase-like flavin-dependent oxidoreductase (luciferase family)
MAASDRPGQVPTWPQVRTFGQHAEAVGLHSVWVCDHLLSDPPDDGIHEGWTIGCTSATFGLLRHHGGRITDRNRTRSPLVGSTRRSSTRGAAPGTGPAPVVTVR